jgi:hypothetical protein
MNRKHKLAVGAASILAAAGGSAAIAASQSGSPNEESQAVIDDAAKQLGISSTKLSDALKKALGDRVDAAVASGRLTKAEGDALKARIQSDGFPFPLGPPVVFGHIGPLAELDAAASFLGLTESQLRAELEGGKSLAQVARDHGKSVDGLVAALVSSAKQRLDKDVAAGRITKAHADEMLNGLKDQITNLVNGTGPGGVPFKGPGFEVHTFEGPFS